jgi:hypothetical protein
METVIKNLHETDAGFDERAESGWNFLTLLGSGYQNLHVAYQ